MIKLSRSKVELFLDCPRCFYLDVNKGIKRPGGSPLSLNLAVDLLLKKEFDIYRQRQTVPEVLAVNGYDYVPFAHKDIDTWRSNFVGISTNYNGLRLYGAIDDVWRDREDNLIIVDYKATASRGKSFEQSSWRDQYKRQLSFYQWLFLKNGFEVLKKGYFVYCRARTEEASFKQNLGFDTEIVEYVCDTSWIEECVENISTCMAGGIPKRKAECEFCNYAFRANENLGFDF